MNFQLILQTLKKDALLRVSEHLLLVVVTMVICIIIGVPFAIIFTRKKDSKILKILLNVLSIFQSIPSFAFIALALPLLGIGFVPAIVALVAQSLLPIIRGSIVGLMDVDKSAIEAAKGMGMNKREILLDVELPLAMHSIVNGIKTSTVYATSAATLAGFIGSGGLGVLISRGLSVMTTEYIIVGSILGAIIAIALDATLNKVKNKFIY